MYDHVWLCMTMYDYVWLCMTMFDYVWLCKTMCDYVWLYMTVGESERKKTILKSFVNFFKVLKLSEKFKLFQIFGSKIIFCVKKNQVPNKIVSRYILG